MSRIRLKCPLCLGRHLQPFIELPDANGVLAKIWQCLDCYCHVPDSVLDMEEGTKLDSQVKFHEELWSQCTAEEIARVRDDLYNMVAEFQSEIGPPSPSRLVVELGCGRGGLLRALLDHGYIACGCEPSLELVAMAREHYGLDEKVLFAETADSFVSRIAEQGNLPDVIIMWHVLEHVQAPLQLLKRCAEMISSGGKLVLQLPLLHSPYVYPEHDFFVTPQTIPLISQQLGLLSYSFEIDSTNKFITVFFGRGNASQKSDADDSEDTLWRGARARAEPILTRDLAIDNLNKALERQQLVVGNLDATASPIFEELASHRKVIAEQEMHLESCSRIDGVNIQLLKSLAEEARNFKEKLDFGESRITVLEKTLAQKDFILNDKDRVLDAQAQLLDEHLVAMQSISNEINLHNETIRGLKQESEELREAIRKEKEKHISVQAEVVTGFNQQTQHLNEQIASQARLIDEHWDALHEKKRENDKLRETIQQEKESNLSAQAEVVTGFNQQIQHLNEQIAGQARLIDERWNAMQEMGREIFKRDRLIQEQQLTLTNLNNQLQLEQKQAQSLKYDLSEVAEYLEQLRGKTIVRVMEKLALIGAPPNLLKPHRSIVFKERTHDRYWWHATAHTHYVPLIYDVLEPSEWILLEEWFNDTEKKYESTGEANVPPLSLLFGLISGNGISRIVQCGHYVGYSTLLLGFLLKKMGKLHALYSIDIDPEVTAYTGNWVSRAGLSGQVHLAINDSAATQEVENAERYLSGTPQLVFIDSSHQYEHTLRELDLWYSALCQGGFLVLHDISKFAASLDKTGDGGVGRAVSEWCVANSVTPLMLNSFVSGGKPGDYPYLDGCGLAIIQKN